MLTPVDSGLDYFRREGISPSFGQVRKFLDLFPEAKNLPEFVELEEIVSLNEQQLAASSACSVKERPASG